MLRTSVIIPSFKRNLQTLKTISLLLNSQGIDREYGIEFIVADSSPDDQLKNELKNKFGEKIVYTRPEKPGIASNKNQGAKVAKNQILIFCDSDMEVEEDTILNTLSALKRHKSAAAIGGQVIWRTGPNDGKHDRPRPEDRMEKINGITYVEALYSRYIATYRKVFWEVGGYDEEVFNMRGEGSDLSIRYWRAGYPLVYDKSLKVHHVYEVEGGIIRGIKHPEWAVAKDLFLLAYKYDVLDDSCKNFIHTLSNNFSKFGDMSFYRILQGLVNNYEFITKIKPILDKQKEKLKSQYNFKFLEVFSDNKLFINCINKSLDKLKGVRENIFI